MPRPNKFGLDYFPLDVNLDDKMELIEAKHGLIGFAVVIKLYQNIYKNGYFMDATEEHILLFKKRVNVDINLITEVINDALRWGLFNEPLYLKYHVLTSRGIQKRFIEASKRRQSIDFINEYILIDNVKNAYPPTVNVNILEVNVNMMSTETPENVNSGTQSKVKNRIEYKSFPQKDPVFAVDEVDEEPQTQPHEVTPSSNGRSYVGVIGEKKVTLKGDLFYGFEKFWNAFDYRKGKAEAAGAWFTLHPDNDLTEKIIEAAKTEADARQDLISKGHTPKWAQGWLTVRRWEDERTEFKSPKPPYYEVMN